MIYFQGNLVSRILLVTWLEEKILISGKIFIKTGEKQMAVKSSKCRYYDETLPNSLFVWPFEMIMSFFQKLKFLDPTENADFTGNFVLFSTAISRSGTDSCIPNIIHLLELGLGFQMIYNRRSIIRTSDNNNYWYIELMSWLNKPL